MPEGTPTISSPDSPVQGLCTLYELKESVFDFLRDTERIFITEEAVTRWLNEAYSDLNSRLRLRQEAVLGTADADGLVVPPAGFLEPISLWFGDIPVQMVDDTVFESYREPGILYLESDVILCRFFGNQFETYPAQIDEDYKLRYVATVEALVDDSDQPTALTPELCVRLRKYALAEAWTKEGDAQLSAAAMSEYLEGLPGRTRLMHRMRPGPVNLIPAPGPFG